MGREHEIKVCVAYEIDGKQVRDFPVTPLLDRARPVYVTLPGWKQDIRGEAVSEACLRNEPYLVTRATTDIAKAYNKFYYEHRILDDDPAGTAARLQLTDACRQVIKTGLYLIGLSAPERM